MDITIYLPDDLGKWAKERELNLSRMLRNAVEDERRRRDASAALAADATVHKLDVREPDGYGGSDDITVRLHGTLVAKQEISGYGSTEVYMGQDEKLYVHDFQGQLYRDIEPDDLRELVDAATYVQAMHAIGQVPVIDVGLPEAGAAGAGGRAPAEPALGRDSVIPVSARAGLDPAPEGGRRRLNIRHIDPAVAKQPPRRHPAS